MRLSSDFVMPDKSWCDAASRLARMDRRELLDRGRQEMAKRADVLLSRAGFDFARGLVGSANVRPGKFFFGSESVLAALELIRQRLPQQAEQIIDQADKVCRHQFDFLGYKDLEYGDPIDWHLDAVHGKQAPRKAFHKIRYLDFAEVGDCKVTWELNRHQHLVTLAKAYRLTDDRRYVDEIFQQWQHWHTENRYAFGINWVSSLEVAFRSLSWTWMYQLLERTPVMPKGFRKEWLRAQAQNGRHVERYLSTYFSPNTHLLGEAVALLLLGTMCPEISRAEHWKSLGWEIVLQEAQRQVQSDGFHFEQSTYYHVYAIDFFLHAVVLASLNELAIPAEFEKGIEKMLDALLLLGRAGAPPLLGDDDGGRLFDPRRNRSEHLLDPLATGAVLFHRGDFKAAAAQLREETIWLLGEQGVAEWDRLQTQQPSIASASLRSAGLHLLATANPPSQLLIDGGPQAVQGTAHGHADALSICLNSEGHAMLIDPGTFEYIGDGTERDLFRRTAMHNTLRVDGKSQSEPAGAFAWKQLTRAKTEQWITGENLDLFVGSHDGYSRLGSPVVHRRWVFSLRSGLFLVRDLVQGSGKHRLDIDWHLGPEMRMRAEHLFGVTGSSSGLAILCAEKHGWSEEVRKDVWSPVYGRKEPITVLTFGVNTSLPAEFVTLLVPLAEAREIPGKLKRVATSVAATAVEAYLYGTPTEEHSFFFAQTGRPWNHGRLASDAEFVYWERKREGEDQLLIFCNGSYVEIEGQRVLTCKRTITRCEMLVREASKEIYASEANALMEEQVASDPP
ncbi:MAG TPA: alginate lyase family protein [Terriglobales bacterium]|nr:alginate lyase family protein [Terriglobales bacterium]